MFPFPNNQSDRPFNPEHNDQQGYQTMDLILNGEEKTVSEVTTVSDLLDHIGYDPDLVAVEVNEEIVSEETYNEHKLSNGDQVEVVTFVGGG